MLYAVSDTSGTYCEFMTFVSAVNKLSAESEGLNTLVESSFELASSRKYWNCSALS
ncbi:hypothetical protein ANAPC1_00400 [Anaplasma phagocytophilum]|uniref:Uncharacterized protein n=1 Tax=Anaplasma phagocytophilum TaxID=948 RepID=A0AA45USK2_ANAPH|nr:hypothetical protein ANAPC1_00400 [Anaplasma phagocytophilum]